MTQNRCDRTEITIIEYAGDFFKESITHAYEELCLPTSTNTVIWIRVVGLGDKSAVKELGEKLGLHTLTIEDVINTDQRPKIEEFQDYTFLILKVFEYDSGDGEFNSAQLSVAIRPNMIVTFEERCGLLDSVKHQIVQSRGIIRKSGVDYLLYTIVDSLVDSYYVLLERIEEAVSGLEDEITSNPSQRTLKSIHQLKRNLIQMQKNLWPLREVIGKLERAGYKFIRHDTVPYFRDLYDHVVAVIESVETLHLTLSDMLDIYFSSLSTRLNEVMKMLTMIATIFMPLTFIAGIYGMNFHHMPELELVWGYPAVLTVMLIIGLTMLFYFKRKKWI